MMLFSYVCEYIMWIKKKMSSAHGIPAVIKYAPITI